MIRRPQISPLFPYTTLSRSNLAARLVRHGFFTMPASSPCLLDVRRTILTAATDDTVKVVESCGRGAPERFYDLVDVVENIASRLPWHILARALSNKRLKLAGGDRSKGIEVLCPDGHGLSSTGLAPAGGSPAA